VNIDRETAQTLKRGVTQLAAPAGALLLSFGFGALLIWLIGRDPAEVYGRFLGETFTSWYGIGQVLFKATPLIFTGFSAAIGFRAGLFNIGADGQLVIGAFLTAWIGATFVGLPPLLLIPLCIIGGMAGGAAWGAIPGYLKARFGSHEVINTIMMNFIAAALVSYLLNNFFSVPATVHTPPIAEGAAIPRLDVFSDAFRGSPVNFSLLLALILAAAVYYLLWKTRLGFELRALGQNHQAARYAGIDIRKRTVLAMTLAGACAGLVGSNFVLGYKHYFELGFSEGTGFIGIAVALLGRNHPLGIVVAALCFGVLEYGGLTVNTIVPKELMNILQASVILFVIVGVKLLQRRATLAADVLER